MVQANIYKMKCAPSKDSDRPLYSRSLVNPGAGRSLGSQGRNDDIHAYGEDLCKFLLREQITGADIIGDIVVNR